MKLIYNASQDAAYNLAMEEYLLTQVDFPLIMLWRNGKSVIVGNNQNAIEEMDLEYTKAHQITVIRRQSGGGAVFHDLGNINFTVILPLGENDFNNYQKFTQPIVDFLQQLGVNAYLKGRNDLLIDGMKFSGNAQAVRNGRIMHHGTLLFHADFGDLAGALRPNPAKIESKGIKSVRSRVTNISSHLESPMEVEDFLCQLYSFFLANSPDITPYALTPTDDLAVRRLVDSKYSQWQWNFGSSPRYDYQKTALFEYGFVDLRLCVNKGIIESAVIYGDFFGTAEKTLLEEKLIGISHNPKAVEEVLREFDFSSVISGMKLSDFLQLL